MKTKKGSHVSIILSFIIFIGFLLFLYPIIVGPIFESRNNNQQTLQELKTNILENISEESTTFSFEITSAAGNSCVEIIDFLTRTGIGSNLVVENSAGVLETAYVLGNNLQIDRISNNEEFFRGIYSPRLEALGPAPGSCQSVQISGYNLGLVKNEIHIFEQDVENLLASYNANYNDLRIKMTSSGRDFDFTFTYNNGTKIGQVKDVPVSTTPEEFSVQYINKDGKVLQGILNLRVW